MKTLDDLTPKIRAKIQKYKDRCTIDLYSGIEDANYNREKLVRYIEQVYSLTNRKKPVIIVADDPLQYKRFFTLLQNSNLKALKTVFNKKNAVENNDYFDDSKIENALRTDTTEIAEKDLVSKSHFLFLCSSYHRVYLTWYKFIQDEFKIKHSNENILNWLYENANNNILRTYFTDLFVLVLKMPKKINRNNNNLHNTTQGAIIWNNYSMYYINGRKMPEDIFNKVLNKKLSFEEFIALTNEDIKAGIITMIKENEGDDALMKFLGASIVDEKTINHSSGYNEIVKLWKTNNSFPFLSDINGNSNQPYCWLELTCPTSKSVYLIDSSSHFTDAVEACKFHRPKSIPMELKYDFSDFNN